jgi:hypothetical protein
MGKFKNKIIYWYYEIKWKINGFFHSIYNLYRWFPVIWRDVDYDCYDIYNVLKFKLNNQANYLEEYDSSRKSEWIRTCIRLIDRIQDEYYSSEYMYYQKSEFLLKELENFPNAHELLLNELEEHFDDFFKKYPLIHKRSLNGEVYVINPNTSKRRMALNISMINHTRAKQLLYKIMETQLDKWSD